MTLSSQTNSHLVELFHHFCLQLVKDVEIFVFQHLVAVNPVGLVKVDLHQVLRSLQTLAGAEQDALKSTRNNKGLSFLQTLQMSNYCITFLYASQWQSNKTKA